ncbi:MAG TPA: Gfo/Idh/MocA family oxidoreductase [Thermoguttaceae bacterium]|nr:Gfo/Idh/MocA family oxidoreductase [Thermoguttaceae bacterium]
MKTRMNRRRFIAGAAWGGAGLLVLRDSASARSYQANDKLNVALVGVGSRGKHFLLAIPRIGENLVALCDVNRRQTEGPAKDLPAARQYRDFRKMLDEMDRQIDAVVVATPVHTHAEIAMAAMRQGKHVYVEKPISHDVGEARVLRDMARRRNVVTQMGNQGMATDSFRRTLELIQEGAIGEVREAHVLFESGGTGPLERPKERPPVPDTLDWDLWLGPAPVRPYHPGYLTPDFPGAGGKAYDATLLGWNRWRDFGAGALGGAGAHSINLAFKALNLEALWNEGGGPRTIRVETEISERCPENFPRCQIVHFDLPARGSQPPAQIHWCNAWDTEIKRRGILERLEETAGQPLKWETGSWSPHSFLLIVGSKGMALTNFHNSVCKLLPEKDFPNAGGPPQRLPRSGSHEREWVGACKGGPKPMSNFDHSGPAVELLLLGNVASLIDRPLEFDPMACTILHDEEANRALRPPRRSGWSL